VLSGDFKEEGGDFDDGGGGGDGGEASEAIEVEKRRGREDRVEKMIGSGRTPEINTNGDMFREEEEEED